MEKIKIEDSRKKTIRKWYYWSPFNQCWMWNGEGVKNWRLQGFTVKKLPI